jgi:hypothetical protein
VMDERLLGLFLGDVEIFLPSTSTPGHRSPA